MSQSMLATIREAAMSSTALASGGVAPAAGPAATPTAAPAVNTQETTEMSSSAPATAAAPASAPTPSAMDQATLDAAEAAGVAKERARIAGIKALSAPGDEALIEAMIADGTSVPDAAVRLRQADVAKRRTVIANLVKADGEVAAAVPAAALTGTESAVSTVPATPDGWRAHYAASPQLQAEFASADVYVAFMEGTARGAIRILNKR